MTWMIPINTFQTQEDNDNEGDSSLRARNSMINFFIICRLIPLGVILFFAWPTISNSPLIYLLIAILIILAIFIGYSVRSRSRSQNFSQRKEPYRLNHNASTITNTQKYCNQCGNIVDRKHIDRVSVFYCIHCGYEIKNSRV